MNRLFRDTVHRLLDTRFGGFLGRQVIAEIRSQTMALQLAAALGIVLLLDPDSAWYTVHSHRVVLVLAAGGLAAVDVFQWFRQRGDDDGRDWYEEWGPGPDDGPGDGELYEPAAKWDTRELTGVGAQDPWIAAAIVAALVGDIEQAAYDMHSVYGTCGCAPRVFVADCEVYNAALVRTEAAAGGEGR